VRRLRTLVSFFGDPRAVRAATVARIASAPGFTLRLASAVHRFLRHTALPDAEREVARELALLGGAGGSPLHLWDPSYPSRLAAIYDAPPVLFIRGSLAGGCDPAVAVVGTRRPTPYGLVMAEYFARELCEAGVTVVSGMARGVDTRAHTASLAARGRTVAVIGTGHDRCYPPENRRLADAIAASGAVVSEYPPETPPDPANFPRRNRIISGLSRGTIVVESDTDGGAMITAFLALDQNREVFAVPGTVHSRKSRGCHALIRDGKAKLVERIDDVVGEIAEGLATPPTGRARATDRERANPGPERRICDELGGEPVHIDLLSGRTDLAIPDLLVHLLALEMKNIVRQLPGKYFVRVP
jgi:DNA processing protein